MSTTIRGATLTRPDDCDSILAPRPEYAVPENRVLVEFRAAVAAGEPYADAESWLANLSNMDGDSEVWERTPAEVEHAERVLQKIMAVHS